MLFFSRPRSFLYKKKKSFKLAFHSFDKYIGYVLDRLFRKFIRKEIIINGFWRSGTTWLQSKICESVKGKSVFEPFGSYVSNDLIYANSGLLKSNFSNEFQSAFMPFMSSENEAIYFKNFIDSTLNANIKSQAVRRLRKSFLSSFRITVVCKYVRGSMLLPYLVRKYPKVPVIHIYRDPRAVITSIIRNGWGYWFEEFSLEEHLLNIDDGRLTYFNKFRKLILKYEQSDPSSRICAYWCLTERFIIDNLSDEKNFLRVSYEDLTDNDFETIKTFLSDYDFKWFENINYNESSATTSKERRLLSKELKRDSWKKEIDPLLKKKIEDIVRDFEMEFCLT